MTCGKFENSGKFQSMSAGADWNGLNTVQSIICHVFPQVLLSQREDIKKEEKTESPSMQIMF